MKILLTLPLLALLLEITLADESVRVKRECNITGCLYCKGFGDNGDGCVFSYNPGCNATGCIRCKGLGPYGDGCEFFPVDRKKREEQITSTDCVTIDGKEECTICTNGTCHTTHSRKKRENNLDENNCNITGCLYCKGLGNKGNGCVFSYNPGCNATGCIRCTGRGINKGDGCVFVPAVIEKRVEQKLGQDIDCEDVDGSEDCLPVDKRENKLDKSGCNVTGCIRCMGAGDHGDGCQFIYNPGCNATGCTRCMGLGPYGDGCTFYPADRKKREDQTSSTNCVAHDGHEDCTICINGACHTTHSRKKRGPSYSYSKTCSNGQCTECRNGDCRTFNV